MIQSSLSSLSKNPFFSSIITLYTLVLLYFPSYFISIFFSPVFLFTFTLLLYILRLGASQESVSKLRPILEDFNSKEKTELDSAELISGDLGSAETIRYLDDFAEPNRELNSAEPISIDFNSPEPNSDSLKCAKNISADLNFSGNGTNELGYVGPLDNRDGTRIKIEPEQESGHAVFSGRNACFDSNSFLEWDVRAPLEVIYEGGEEEDQNGDVLVEGRDTQMAVIDRYTSLSMYYPETDTDSSSSEMDFPATGELMRSPDNGGFRWEEEDDVEGLIEIELDRKLIMKNEVEEDNLIEIDLSPTR